MDPVTAAAAILTLVDWNKIAKSIATDSANKQAKNLLARLQPTNGEKASRKAIELFTEEFLSELADKTGYSDPLPGYDHQIAQLIDMSAPDIVRWLRPETETVDLTPVQGMWTALQLAGLPDSFDWPQVAKNFARAIRKHVKNDSALREILNTALLEQQAASLTHLAKVAPLDPGFDLANYREFLRKGCETLQLSAMHTSTYARRILLWSVFVPQSAREAAPVRDLPRELLRRLRQEGHTTREVDVREIDELRQRFQSSPVRPVLEILERNRLVVILGDPGSGKTSLLKSRVLSWVSQVLCQDAQAPAPLPLWIDLKEYAREPTGFLEYCGRACTTYCLDPKQIQQQFREGKAVLYLDGLDEIFDPPTRGAVLAEAIAFSSRYPQAPIVVTSRIIGYEPGRLAAAGFVHATLEDFDDAQIREFLTKWYNVAEDDPKERTRLQAQLDKALHESRAVRDLAGNPLLLTMMAILNRTQDLPRDRVELYAQASRVLLHEWDASRSLPVDLFARQEKEELLRELAGVMQEGEGGLAGNLIERDRLIALFRQFLKERGIADWFYKAEDLLHQLEERNFILCFAGADRFSFVHRTFLEFYCADWFVKRFEKKQTLTLDQIKTEVFGTHWRDERWHEVLRLIAGMVEPAQAGALIQFLMDQDGSHVKFMNLLLAAECLNEVRNRRAIQAIDERLRNLLFSEVLHEDPTESLKYPVTQPRAVHLIAAVWDSDLARDWLKSALNGHKNRFLRQAAVRELARGWTNDPATWPWLQDCARSKDEAVRQAAVRELAQGWHDDPATLPLLLDRARSDEGELVRLIALLELAQGWHDHPETLPLLLDRARSEEHEYVRQVAVQELAEGWHDHPETLPLLLDTVHSDVAFTRRVAVRVLAKGWPDHPDTLPLLLDRARSDEDENVRQVALQQLAQGWPDNPEVTRLLAEPQPNITTSAQIQPD